MEQRDPLELAQLIVRGSYINISLRSVFFANSGIYRFTNEDIFSYYNNIKNKVLFKFNLFLFIFLVILSLLY